MVSYYAPTGDYSVDSHYFDTARSNGPLSAPAGNNGVFGYGGDGFPSGSFGNSNYWVDPIVSTGQAADTTPPSVESVTPLNTAVSVSTAAKPTANFSEPVNPATVQFQVRDSNNASVAGSVALNAANQVATFTPMTALARGVTYIMSVTASDTAGNAMTAPATNSFTTMQPDPAAGACPCAVWPDSNVPTVIAASDSSAVELGTTFTADVSGTVTAIRFYKAATNTGVHKVTLWSAGSPVATATATNEPASGWVTVAFPTAVSIAAGTTYLASYNTTTGNYSATPGAVATAGIDVGPLHVPVHGSAYVYGAGLPTNSSDTTYAVTPVLVPAADTTPPVVTGAGAAPASVTATVTWTTDEVSSSQVVYGTSATSLASSASGAGGGTAHSVPLTGLSANTTYYYRVVSADVAGNSTTSPASSASAATFTTTAAPDTTPPAVSSVVATPTGTSATITWITDEAATTRVDYGTSATSLTLNSTVAGLATAHSVNLSGLAINTRYYFRVTSADAAANSTTAPATSTAAATFAPAVSGLVDSTTANFMAGTRTNATVSDFGADASSAGEVISTPTTNTDFPGTTLPTGWTSTPVAAGGSSTVGGGFVTISGATLATSGTYTNGKSLEAQVVLAPGQAFGWVSSGSNASIRSSFSVDASNRLIASEYDGNTSNANNTTAVIATGWTPVAHKLRIEWTSTAMTFYVDDVQKYTHAYNSSLSPNQRPFFNDAVTTDAGLVLDWARVGPFAGSSVFVSRAIDESAPVTFDAITWDASVPTGTTMTVQVRTATVSGSWSAWTTISASGTSINKTGRYFQYKVLLATTGSRFVTATLRSVQVAAHV